jgi:Concanavalin A-like lectin/glucanases superfamily
MKTIRIIFIVIFGLSLQLVTSCEDQNSSTLGNGLLAFYNFNNNIEDQSGNGHNGTAFGGSYIFELDGNGTYKFNGNGDYIKVNNSSLLNPINAITISLWFNPIDYYGTGNDALVLKPFTSHTAPYYQYILGIAGSYGINPYTFGFCVNVNGVYTGINSGANTWTEGNWYHVVGMYDGQTLKLYVNGVLKSSYAAEGTITVYDSDLFLAKQANIAVTTPGIIDNVRIYKRALSEKEIMEIYQNSY